MTVDAEKTRRKIRSPRVKDDGSFTDVHLQLVQVQVSRAVRLNHDNTDELHPT